LKIFLSSRHNDSIIDLLQDLPVTELEVAENNTEDIEKFVKRTAKEASSKPGNRRKYARDGLSQEEAVVDRLLAKAGGMFRWVQMAFDFLHASIDYDAMTRRLDQLSHLGKLFDVYDRIYDEMVDQVDEADQARIRTLLTFLLHGGNIPRGPRLRLYDSREIINIEHILEACEFSATADPFEVPMSVERVRSLCPSLVITTKRKHHSSVQYDVTFPHVSVPEWLLTSSKRSDVYRTLPGHQFLSQLCMKVISAVQRQSKRHADGVAIKNTNSTDPAEMTALLQYSCPGWLDHIHSLSSEYKPPCPVNQIWLQEAALRTTLESFLFDLNKQTTAWTDKLVTGFQLWHQLCSRQIGVQADENSDDEAVAFYMYPAGMLPEVLYKYWLKSAALPAPAFICALLRHHCDLSRFPEAAMGVTIRGQDWRIQSLAATIGVDDADTIKWLIQQVRPSPEDLADALLLNVNIGLWPDLDEFDKVTGGWKASQARAWLPQLLQLLVVFGLDVNGRHGPSETPLLVRLILAWVRSESRGIAVGAIMVASLIDLGADALVPVEISKEDCKGNDDLIDLDVSQLKTVFDWILLWGIEPETSGIESQFLARQWDKSVWERWLKYAVCDSHCSPNLVQRCLENGADLLLSGGEFSGPLPLTSAIDADCSGLVLDILSVATFAAGADLHADDYALNEGEYLPEIIAKCSKTTIKLWNDNGADIAGIDIDQAPWHQNSPIQIAKRRTEYTGDSSVEEYLRSLGISTPTRDLSISGSMNSTSAQLVDSGSDVKSERVIPDDDSSPIDSSAVAYQASHHS
jgi:hypothetical protein